MAVLDHVAREETDIESQVRFYRDVLGFELVRWGTHVVTGRRIAMLADPLGTKVELIEVDEILGDLAHLAYRVPDVASAHASLLSAGCQELRPPFYLAPAKAHTSFLRGASGGQIQLIAYDPDSPDLRGVGGAVG